MRKPVFSFILMTWLTLFFTITGNLRIAAQSITDTIFQIPDVVISASRGQNFRNDLRSDVFSEEDIGPFSGESLGHFLISSTALNIKSCGAGGATGVSLRGTSTSHVQVNWNGFPINSVTLGSADFSMIPVSGFDKISLVYGAPGALYGSGTFGGAINLDSDLKPEKALGGSAKFSYESLNSINGHASLHLGSSKIAWKINAWGTHSDNIFTYFDYIRQSKRKQNDGEWSDAGVIQNAVLRLSPSSTLEAGLWYQVKSYNIPSRIGSASFETQKDSTLKIFAGYKNSGNRWGLHVKAALFNDKQSYFQKASAQSAVNSIKSHISAIQYYGDANFRYYIRPYLSIDAGIICTYISADVSAFGGIQVEKGFTSFAGIKYDKNRLSAQTEVRKDWNSNFHSGLLPSFGISYKIVPEIWVIRANFSKKFRKPTFNDLFWIPGGNSDLKPETGYSVETGSLVTILKKENLKLTSDLGLYWSQIRDMITWRPSGVYWIAKNYQGVRVAGIDAKLIFDLQSVHFKYRSSLMVMLNRSLLNHYDGETKEKMLYSPRVISSWENRITSGLFEFTLWHHFTADRFYSDNSLLPPYQLVDVQTGIKIPTGKGKIGIYLMLSNLTNTTYELIRLYPMPGRNWSVKMSYTF